MKRLLLVLSILFFCSEIVFADEVVLKSTQTQDIQDNKAVINIQKQPTNEHNSQKQAVKNNWFCIVVQINGKIKDLDTANSDNK